MTGKIYFAVDPEIPLADRLADYDRKDGRSIAGRTLAIEYVTPEGADRPVSVRVPHLDRKLAQ